ncbi:HAD-IA family hydrolase [Vallitalea okinawensis]|uniref:HAD-IA family hydrolase n=1 Tax=Vallitalea okinawensis TaxID=2078660 RepID=UPI000CFADCDE|nr:HAD-IA family hydrolase [Vallitalea okinawensis]
MFKHIIWDFDGTLYDTYPTITLSFKKALEHMGIVEDHNMVSSMVKVAEAHALDYYERVYKIDRKALKEKYDTFRKEVQLMDVKPFPSVDAICKDIVIAKKYNYIYTNRGKSIIDHLDHFDLLQYFTDIIRRENNFARKPAPNALLYLLDKHKMNPLEVIMIGDRDIDILAGKNAGIRTCYFDFDNEKKVEIADYTVNDMKELYGIIGL